MTLTFIQNEQKKELLIEKAIAGLFKSEQQQEFTPYELLKKKRQKKRTKGCICNRLDMKIYQA